VQDRRRGIWNKTIHSGWTASAQVAPQGAISAPHSSHPLRTPRIFNAASAEELARGKRYLRTVDRGIVPVLALFVIATTTVELVESHTYALKVAHGKAPD
jgi:hypothetical protein